MTISLLHGKTLVLIDHKNRRLMYVPEYYYANDDHYALAQFEIMSYLYENTISFHKIDLLEFEE